MAIYTLYLLLSGLGACCFNTIDTKSSWQCQQYVVHIVDRMEVHVLIALNLIVIELIIELLNNIKIYVGTGSRLKAGGPQCPP